MKNILLSLLLCLTLLLTACAVHPVETTPTEPPGTEETTSLTQPTESQGQETEGIEDPAFADENHLREVVSAYFASRAEYLSSDGERLITAAVDGIIQDELLHLQALQSKSIDFLTSEITFGQIYNESTHAFVYVTETITCQTNGETITETVEHYLYVDAYQGGIVGSDSYMEKCSGFASCAYVEPENETEPASLEPDATALTAEEMAALELTLQDTQSWYPRFLLAASFTGLDDPEADFALFAVFANGAPDEEAVRVTDEEKQLLTEKYGDLAERDFYRLSKETVVNTLVSYLGLSQEDALAMAMEAPGVHYLEQTDSFYTTETYNTMEPGITAAYYRDDGTISVYYRDLVYERGPEAHTRAEPYYSHVAVLRPEGDGYVILSNQRVNP